MSTVTSVVEQTEVHHLEMMQAQGDVILEGNDLQIQPGLISSKTVSLPMDALRFVYLFYPEQFKWRLVESSSTTYSFVDLDTLPPEHLAELGAAAGRNRFLMGSFHFILADYEGHVVRVSWKKLAKAGIDPLGEFLRHRESRQGQRGRWLQKNPGVIIPAKKFSLSKDISMNAAGARCFSTGKFLPWPFLADVKITKDTSLNICHFQLYSLETEEPYKILPAVSTGISPKFTEICLAEIHFWSSLGKAQAAQSTSLLEEMGLSTQTAAAAPPAPALPPTIPNNALSNVSLTTGILGWTLLPFIGALAAIVTGHLAFRAIRRSEGREGGKNRAKIGLALGYVQIGLILLVIVL